jgi:hypothetical protein
VEVAADCPPLSELPSPRCHLLDLAPSVQSVARWLPLATSCLNCVLCACGPPPRLPPLEQLLGGHTVLRLVKDLHPHLVLDLASLALGGNVEIRPWIELHTHLDTFGPALSEFLVGAPPRWPVLSPAAQPVSKR